MGYRAAGAVMTWFVAVAVVALGEVFVSIGSIGWYVINMVGNILIFIGWLGGIFYFVDIASHRLSMNTMIHYTLMFGGFIVSVASLLSLIMPDTSTTIISIVNNFDTRLVLVRDILYLVCMPWMPILISSTTEKLLSRNRENTGGSR